MIYRLGPTASRFFWLLLFLWLALATCKFGWQTYQAWSAKDWPVTTGTVVGIYETPQYEYSVGGATHFGNHASCNELVEFFSEKNYADYERYLVKYPVNSKVPVHYHPRDPSLSVLETKFDPFVLTATGIPALLSLICALGFSRGWRLKLGRGYVKNG
jgi:uncharacterized protein DUF3592